MIYIEHNNTDPYFNFALEEYFAIEKELPDNEILLLWRTDPTVMVGRYQNTYQEVNQTYAEQNNVHVVRRNSGGGAIYTDKGAWQFTYIIKGYQGGIDFKRFTAPVIAALEDMGVHATFNSRNDIYIGERKISGNAQWSRADVMVHHGSLLFDCNITAMVKSITVAPEKIISKGIQSVRERVTNILEHLPDKVDETIFQKQLLNKLMQNGSSIYTLSQSDTERISTIANQKFRSWDWNYGTSPKCSIEKGHRFTGGRVDIKLTITHGMIEYCYIYGDFFAENGVDEICGVLKGCCYDKESVYQALKNAMLENAIYQVSLEELTDCIML